MKWRWTSAIFGLTFWALALGLQGQGLTRPGDIPAALQAQPKILLKFDSKRSFISNRDVKIFGLRAGMNFDNKIATGFGFYFLSSPFIRNFVQNKPTGGRDTIGANLEFAYMSFWAEYILLTSKRWELSLPLSIGFGEARFRGFEATTETPIVLLEASLEAQYKIVEWLGLGAGFGYRQPIAGRPSIRENFNAPIYRFGIRFFLGYFYHKIFPQTAP